MTADNAMAAALRLLTMRGHSEAELTARLQRKGLAAEMIAGAVNRCRELGYLNDAQFALERARSLMRSGRAVGRRLLADLKGRGVGEDTALAAIEQVREEFAEEAILTDLLRRRFPDFSYRAADDRQRRRVVNFFQRRGFSLSLVLSFLQEER